MDSSTLEAKLKKDSKTDNGAADESIPTPKSKNP